MSGHRESFSSITPDILRIPRKNKIKKTPDTLIMIKQPIKEPVNPSKRKKKDTIPDVEKGSPKETTPLFRNKVDYRGDTNEKTHGSDDSPSENDGCVRNLAKEHENEEDK